MIKNYERVAFWALAIGALLVIVLPYLFTRASPTGVSFTTTGQIGDTIGGLTAPVIGLVSAMLLFLALRAQVEANRLVRDQFAEQQKQAQYDRLRSYLLQQVQLIREEIDRFTTTAHTTHGSGKEKTRETTQYSGVEAMQEILVFLAEHHDEKGVRIDAHPELVRIVTILDRLLRAVSDARVSALGDTEREFLLGSAEFTYRATLYPILRRLEAHRTGLKQPCKQHGVIHEGLPEELYGLYDKLNKLFNISHQELIADPIS